MAANPFAQGPGVPTTEVITRPRAPLWIGAPNGTGKPMHKLIDTRTESRSLARVRQTRAPLARRSYLRLPGQYVDSDPPPMSGRGVRFLPRDRKLHVVPAPRKRRQGVLWSSDHEKPVLPRATPPRVAHLESARPFGRGFAKVHDPTVPERLTRPPRPNI